MSTAEIPARAAIAAMEAVIWEHAQELDRAHAENLGLRAVLAEHGIVVPAATGVATLARLRALENVLDLAREACRRPTARNLRTLREAAIEAGRQP